MSTFILIVIINFSTYMRGSGTKFVQMQEFNSYQNCVEAAKFIKENHGSDDSSLTIHCTRK